MVNRIKVYNIRMLDNTYRNYLSFLGISINLFFYIVRIP